MCFSLTVLAITSQSTGIKIHLVAFYLRFAANGIKTATEKSEESKEKAKKILLHCHSRDQTRNVVDVAVAVDVDVATTWQKFRNSW